MSEYSFEQARKAFAACANLRKSAPTPIEKDHWKRQEAAWRARMDEARRSEQD